MFALYDPPPPLGLLVDVSILLVLCSLLVDKNTDRAISKAIQLGLHPRVPNLEGTPFPRFPMFSQQPDLPWKKRVVHKASEVNFIHF